jgi:uncharacterized protein (TIGR02246 family)
MSDREDIRRVIALYAQLIDDKRFAEWGDLFTADARFVARGEAIEGREHIVSSISSMMAAASTKHLTATPVVDLVEAGHALAWTDATTFAKGDGGIAAVTLARVYDELRRGDDGRWRISSRVIVQTGDPLPEGVTPSPGS